MLPMVSGSDVDMHGFKCDADTVSRVKKFQQQMKRYPDEPSAKRGLRSEFGGTYMYYYSFQPVPVHPEHPAGHYYMGNTFYFRGQIDLALIHYRHAVRLAPGYVAAHIKLGDVLMSLRKPGEAAAHYRVALRVKPDAAEAREKLDRIMARKTNDGG